LLKKKTEQNVEIWRKFRFHFQLNSLAPAFTDFHYLLCFYTSPNSTVNGKPSNQQILFQPLNVKQTHELNYFYFFIRRPNLMYFQLFCQVILISKTRFDSSRNVVIKRCYDKSVWSICSCDLLLNHVFQFLGEWHIANDADICVKNNWIRPVISCLPAW
jgi:hypothetical protein